MEKIKVIEFGTIFHTYLRKYTDSEATSICYNAISLMERKDWKKFITFMVDKEVNRENCLSAVDLGREPLLNIFHIGLRMMNDNEYKHLNEFINGKD